MKKHLLILATAVLALCAMVASCQKEEEFIIVNDPVSDTTGNGGQDDTTASTLFAGVYDLHMVYDSITTSDGTWWDEEFFETMTGKINKPKNGYLTITDLEEGSYTVTATIVDASTGEERTLFTTTAIEQDSLLILAPCTSDYYYSTTEEIISFIFRNFENRLPEIYFKGIYTINLGADYSYLNSYTCTKRR